jgi:hypothetical protein
LFRLEESILNANLLEGERERLTPTGDHSQSSVISCIRLSNTLSKSRLIASRSGSCRSIRSGRSGAKGSAGRSGLRAGIASGWVGGGGRRRSEMGIGLEGRGLEESGRELAEEAGFDGRALVSTVNFGGGAES